MADNRPSKSNLPQGIQISQPTAQNEEETKDTNQVELAMATMVSEIEAIDPQSLEEAMKRPDKSKWVVAIQEELENLQKAGTWKIVERPKERNIVKNKWVFRIKKDAAGKVKCYKARLIAKGFTQVFGVDYYDTWAPMAKLGSICFYLPQLQNMDGPLICLTSTALSLMENLILMKKFKWSSLKDMKNQTKNGMCVNYSNLCMD